MKRMTRRLSRVADSSQHPALEDTKGPHQAVRGGEGRQHSRRVPRGHVPMCVGKEMQRFVVRAEILGRQAFLELLHLSAQEYGYEQQGVLRIPFPAPLFHRLLLLLSSSSSDPALEELFRSLPDDIPRSSSASPAQLSLR
ncbi:auxin-responsive protein SAUR71-like [Musa acuminata AAA Group]|uniref:auxin-responsive protein SAUR71-like n=1 Tax=Musa acuminata AAA Group TaxID=214697 RepID=UPI0031CF6470